MRHLLTDSSSSHKCQNMWLKPIGLVSGQECCFVFCAFFIIFFCFITVNHQRELITSRTLLKSSCPCYRPFTEIVTFQETVYFTW